MATRFSLQPDSKLVLCQEFKGSFLHGEYREITQGIPERGWVVGCRGKSSGVGRGACHCHFSVTPFLSLFLGGPTQLNQASFDNDFQDNCIAHGGELTAIRPLGGKGKSLVPNTN